MVTYRLFSRAGFTGSGCGVVSAIGTGGLKEFSILPIHIGDDLAYELIILLIVCLYLPKYLVLRFSYTEVKSDLKMVALIIKMFILPFHLLFKLILLDPQL